MSIRFLIDARYTVRSAACAAALCLVCAIPSNAQEALPLVRVRQGDSSSPAERFSASTGAAAFAPEIVLASEPLDPSLRLVRDPVTEPSPYALVSSSSDALETLASAVRANDFATFTAALSAAHSVADQSPAGDARSALRRKLSVYDDVERLWRFSRSDAFGSFYDEDALPGFYAKLTRDYSGYAEAMEPLRVVDSHGTLLLPTAETRAFLLRKIGGASRQTPVLTARASRHARQLTAEVIAPATSHTRTTQRVRATHSTALATADVHVAPVLVAVNDVNTVARHASGVRHEDVFDRRRNVAAPRRAQTTAIGQLKPVALPESAPRVGNAPSIATPVAVAQNTARTVAAPAVNASSVAIAPSATTLATKPAAPLVATPAVTSAKSDVSHETPVDTTSRAILFILVGLIAIGMLSLVLRAPRTAPMALTLPAQAAQMPAAQEAKPEPLPEDETIEEERPKRRRRAR